MKPKYSIFYYKKELNNCFDLISSYLNEGVKVFWFGSASDVIKLRNNFKPFIDAFFLQVFNLENLNQDYLSKNDFEPTIIVDGEGINTLYKELFNWIEECIPEFNAAQFRVEHALPDSNIVVKASAGTGKTTVMVDRILYLMHTVPNLDMSEIYMITFTNEATNQMNDRLQEMLMKKYSLTKNKRYLTWLEQQSTMHISTIDSLAFDLFKRFGSGVGFGRDMQIQPMEKDRKELIKDILSDELNDRRAIISQIGMTYSEAGTLIDNYWKELTRKGYTVSDVINKNWGESDSEVGEMQRVMKAVLLQFEERYRQIKLDANAISLNDLFFDFGHFLLEERLSCEGLDMKYLFVDEFQDTDATQIMSFAKLVRDIDVNLFVVGDVKQSIYGFKGATDAAFSILDKEMDGNLTYYSLRNNYRTCSNLMKNMEKYFFDWARRGLLGYEESVRPFNNDTGTIEMHLIHQKDEFDGYALDAINESLEQLELDIKAGRKKVSSKSKVAVLVRGSKKAEELANICRANGKTVVLNSDRPFFRSRAVRDFYALISSYIFVDQPLYMYNYLMTPYASFKDAMSIREMEKLNGDTRAVQKYLKQFLAETKWMDYQKEFRIRPVLSVIKDIIENDKIIDNYISRVKANLFSTQMTEAGRNKQALIDAKRYRMNLDKLMEMIQQRMDGEFATLYDLYVYLSLMIATNRDEKEPDIDMKDDYTSVYIMTVHKSKGLEFDTVIMPAMNGSLIPWEDTKILVNDKKVAWYYKKPLGQSMKSRWYEDLRKEDIDKGVEEETRILYVAMTRAVSKLVLLLNDWNGYESWSSLIRKVGLTNE